MALFPSFDATSAGGWLNRNSDTLLQSGIGLLSGRNANEQAAMGLQGFQQGRRQNKTADWLSKNAPPELAQAVHAGVISPADAYKTLLASKTNKPPIQVNGKLVDPETYQVVADFSSPAKPNRSFQTLPDGTYGVADLDSGTFNPLGSAPKDAGGNGELGLNLVWGRDRDGNTRAFQPSKTGGLVPVQIEEGVQLSDPYTRAFDSASGKEGGERQGGASAGLPAAKQNVGKIDVMVNDIKNDPSLDSVLGWFDSRTPNLSSGANRVQSKINQISGQAFLEARQMLKGGGAITDFESKKAEEAIIRLNQAQSAPDFRRALDDFNQAVKDGYAKLEREAATPNNQGPRPAGLAGGTPAAPAAPAGLSPSAGTGANTGSRTSTGATWRIK